MFVLGLAPQVTVMPHGVDADLCAPPPSPQRKSNRKRIYRDPELEKLVAAREASPATRRFMFLYHGGLLWRKGLDRLLEAYNKEFYGNRAVVLVIHGVYGQQGVQVGACCWSRISCFSRKVTKRQSAWGLWTVFVFSK